MHRGVIFHAIILSKLIQRNRRILIRALESLKNLHFNTLLGKLHLFWTKKIQRSYLSWHWSVMQNLEENRHVISKLSWGIWQILTQSLGSLKVFASMGFFWPKYIMFELKKVQRSYVWWHWRLLPNLKENWVVLSKNDTRNW